MLIYVIVLIALYLYYHLVHKRRHLPPGPTPWPFFGNIIPMIKEAPGEEVFKRWKREYGNVFTYWMGSIPVVIIADHTTMVEAYQKNADIHSGRPDFTEFELMVRGVLTGLMLIDGEEWKEQRRFSIKALRDFGVSRTRIQDRVLEEVLTVFNSCDKSIESGAHEHDLFAETEIAVGSLINSFLFGYRFHGEQRNEFFHLKKLLVDHINAFGHPLVQMSMTNPHIYKHLPFFKHHIKRTMDTATDLMNFFSDQIDKQDMDIEYDKDSSNFVQAFMHEWNRLDTAGEKHYFNRKQLESMCYDMWINGQSTISTTISWGCAFLIHNQDVQQKCQDEMDRFIGADRLVTMTDKPNLPYCNATMEEIYRVANITPHVLWHRTLKDTEVGGYSLQKDTLTMPQFSAGFIDENVFPEPYKFNPDRFIDKEGKFKRADEVIPFSIGKRKCSGENLARTEIFLFIFNIINRYKLSSGKQLPSLERKIGFAILIDAYLCKMERRV